MDDDGSPDILCQGRRTGQKSVWRIAGQDTADSTWRLGPELPRLTTTVSVSPPSVTLEFRLPRLHRYDPLSLTIQRRQPLDPD